MRREHLQQQGLHGDNPLRPASSTFLHGHSETFQGKISQLFRKVLVTSPTLFHPVSHVDIILAPCLITGTLIAGPLFAKITQGVALHTVICTDDGDFYVQQRYYYLLIYFLLQQQSAAPWQKLSCCRLCFVLRKLLISDTCGLSADINRNIRCKH